MHDDVALLHQEVPLHRVQATKQLVVVEEDVQHSLAGRLVSLPNKNLVVPFALAVDNRPTGALQRVEAAYECWECKWWLAEQRQGRRGRATKKGLSHHCHEECSGIFQYRQ